MATATIAPKTGLLTPKRIVLGIGALPIAAMYLVGLYLLATTSGPLTVPTPIRAIVGGGLAMFATLGAFSLGFVVTVTQQND